jgi:Tol biopolymer transport system component
MSVSRYTVVGPIGAGGMGEVYQAQDSSLDRMVALKILPPDMLKNDERRRRFIQEARSASSLNHPHIVTIHEIGETTIEPSGVSIHYIAMELIDGSTLKRKIHQEQLELRTTLSYLAQAADGLAKAHAAGIIHRDLKPENIMVTRDGFAKVLDFGLAKLSVRKSATESVDDPTAVREVTREGAVLGTVAYMSPEQVTGKVVDHRTDIFSFGAILYEAATRRRPFDAESDVDVMHKILHDPPPPIDAGADPVPAELRRIIRRCLAKDPDRRYQAMKDLAIDLRDLVDNYDEFSVSATSGGSSSEAALAAAPRKRNVLLWTAVSVAVLALAALGYLAWRTRSQPVASAAPNALTVQRLTSSGDVSHAAMSRDGRYLALVVRDREGRFSLRVRQAATGSEVEVVPAERKQFAGLNFSPDGTYVYYARREEEGGTVGWLYQVPALGGTSQKIIYDVDTPPAFSPDGKQLAFGRGQPQKQENLYIVANADGSGARTIAAFPRFGAAILSGPAWSPDGRKLMAARLLPPGSIAAAVEIDVATGEKRDIPSTAGWVWINSIDYRPDGSGVFLSAERKGDAVAQLWFQPLPHGEPRRISNDFSDYRRVSTTADGKSLAATAIETEGEMHVGSIGDATGGVPLDAERSSRVRGLACSASGSIVYVRQEKDASNIYILDNPAAQPRRLTSSGFDGEPSIAADGKTIVYSRWDKDSPHIWAVDSDGGNARQITNGAGEYAPQISPDGKLLQYVEQDALWRRPLDGGKAVKLADRPTGVHGFSNDSKLTFYRQWLTAGSTVVLRVERVSGGPALDLPSLVGREHQFSPDDRGIVYISPMGGAENLQLLKLDGSAPVPLTKYTRGGIDSFGWTPDGKIISIRTQRRSDVVLYSGF